MFGRIVYISDNIAHVSIPKDAPVIMNLMNMHVVFEDEIKKILGEVEDISAEIIKIRFLGELADGKFIGGVLRKPNLTATTRIINAEELKIIMGEKGHGQLMLGMSPLYEDMPVNVDINEMSSNHMAIFGNTGSGKSYGVARYLQSLFYTPEFIPFKSNFMVFDAYGEYHNAFRDINHINPNYNFKFYTTNKAQLKEGGEMLRIPLWLLNIDDFALLLNAERHSQLPIIERMLKLVRVFATDGDVSTRYKNHLIAKSIMDIIYTNQTAASKRNDIFSILSTCSTVQFNLEAPVQGLGYVRRFRECFLIDTAGQFTESILITQYITSFIDEELEKYEPTPDHFFTLDDMEKALQFTLISEGLLRNERLYDEAITLKVRLHSIAIGDAKEFFAYPQYISMENFVASLVTRNGRKAQIVNFNLEDAEDRIAKTIVKIYSKLLFDFTKRLNERASIPFHLVLEESHRYVQNDNDNHLLGYNIFERIAKEGRKFGLLLMLISQRPVELSETVISQITNFLIFKMTHPRDLEYMKKMLPNMSSEIMEKQKSLQSGTCVAFGRALKIPMIVRMPLPNPEPYSSNADVVGRWTT
jgi:Predicted ATPase